MKKLFYTILLAVISSCIWASESMSDKIKIKAKLKEFVVQAVAADYMDGRSVSYDLSVFVIMYPKQYEGIEVHVQHFQTPGSESIWRSVGKEFSMLINEKSYYDGAFFGTVETIEIIGEVQSERTSN